MILPIVVALQAAEASNVHLAERGCPPPSSKGDEVVVCGRRDGNGRYRIEPTRYDSQESPSAKINIGNAMLAAEAQQGEVGGIPTNRAMITFKIKF